MIAASPTELQPVLDAVAEGAARLCEATDVLIDRVDGDVLEAWWLAYGLYADGAKPAAPLVERRPPGRAIIDCQTIHIHDVLPTAPYRVP